MRIAWMVFRLLFAVPYYWVRIWRYGKNKKYSHEEIFSYIKKITKRANRAGRVTIESYGMENLPKEDGFIMFPNHQGLFDVLVFLDACPKSFSFLAKKEASEIILLKQVMQALGAYAMDRGDVRQSMGIINSIAEDVKKGRNFLIFPEGTRSKKGNEMLTFKGGSFKSATKAKCPIVPCALIDSFKPFDEKSIKPVTVKLFYLPPMYYEEYKEMKTVEIAEEVKRRIGEAMAEAGAR